MIMRWTGIIVPALLVVGLLNWSDGRPDDGMRSEDASYLVRTATAEDFRHRHAAHGIECAACHGDEPDHSMTPTTLQCLTCHESHEAVAALTEDMTPNPHHSHMGEVACIDCHSEHRASRLICNQCHVFEMDVP